MSEPNSLYIKLRIKKENLDRFFQAKPAPAVIDEDWTAWWNSRKMYSQRDLTEIPHYPDDSNRAIFDAYLANDSTGTGEQHEPDAWYACIVFFSENYYEILPMLAWLKAMAPFMEKGEGGVAIVYDFFWGGRSVMAHLELKEGQATLKHTQETTAIAPEVINEANETLQKVFDSFSDKWQE